jgi:hypothetical protein
MKILILAIMLTISGWSARAQTADICGGPPPVANEDLKGEIEGRAQFLSRFLGEAELGGKIETSRSEIFSRYPDADERSDAYFEYQVCVLLMEDRSISNIEKIEKLKEIRREFSQPKKKVEDEYFKSISNRTITIGAVDISNMRLSPMPPASILERESVSLRFNYNVCCNSEVRIWIKPVITGSNCTYAYSPSPLYKGTGSGDSDFHLRGTGCSSARVDALHITVEREHDKKETGYQLKVLYTIL